MSVKTWIFLFLFLFCICVFSANCGKRLHNSCGDSGRLHTLRRIAYLVTFFVTFTSLVYYRFSLWYPICIAKCKLNCYVRVPQCNLKSKNQIFFLNSCYQHTWYIWQTLYTVWYLLTTCAIKWNFTLFSARCVYVLYHKSFYSLSKCVPANSTTVFFVHHLNAQHTYSEMPVNRYPLPDFFLRVCLAIFLKSRSTMCPLICCWYGSWANWSLTIVPRDSQNSQRRHFLRFS